MNCTICNAPLDPRGVCPNCGFDLGQNYEQYPTLVALAGMQSLSARRKALTQKGRDPAEGLTTVVPAPEPVPDIEPGTKSRKSPLIWMISIAAAVALILLLPRSKSVSRSAATSAEPTPWVEGDWSWDLTGEVLTISGTGNMKNYDAESYPVLNPPWFSPYAGITKVFIEDGITGIGDYAFDHCWEITNVSIPASVTHIGKHAFRWCDALKEIQVDAGNPRFCSIDGVLFSKDGRELLVFPAAHIKRNAYSIPSSVTVLGDYAFYGCEYIQSLDIPNSVLSIGDGAFEWCRNLTSVKIPNGLTRIGNYTFHSCGISSVSIPESVTSIGDSAFLECNQITSVSIPGSVTSIGDYAFGECWNLRAVSIPDSVTILGRGVFQECENLANVYYAGTAEQWEALTSGKDIGLPEEAVVHFAS